MEQATKFVKLWIGGTSVEDIGKQFDMSRASVYDYASYLRKKGVKLPKRVGQHNGNINVSALNKIISGKEDKPTVALTPRAIKDAENRRLAKLASKPWWDK